jgi:hypothetical protein
MNRKILFSLVVFTFIVFQKQLNAQTGIKEKKDTIHSLEMKSVVLHSAEAEPLNPFSQIPYSSTTPKEAIVKGCEKDRVILKKESAHQNYNEKKTISKSERKITTVNKK